MVLLIIKLIVNIANAADGINVANANIVEYATMEAHPASSGNVANVAKQCKRYKCRHC